MVSKTKMTEWFDKSVKPARRGWYQIQATLWPGKFAYRYWTGRAWGPADELGGDEFAFWGMRDYREIGNAWRGLTKPAGKK